MSGAETAPRRSAPIGLRGSSCDVNRHIAATARRTTPLRRCLFFTLWSLSWSVSGPRWGATGEWPQLGNRDATSASRSERRLMRDHSRDARGVGCFGARDRGEVFSRLHSSSINGISPSRATRGKRARHSATNQRGGRVLRALRGADRVRLPMAIAVAGRADAPSPRCACTHPHRQTDPTPPR